VDMASLPLRPSDHRSVLRRQVTASLDAVGVSAESTTGKIGVPVVRASEVEGSSVD